MVDGDGCMNDFMADMGQYVDIGERRVAEERMAEHREAQGVTNVGRR